MDSRATLILPTEAFKGTTFVWCCFVNNVQTAQESHHLLYRISLRCATPGSICVQAEDAATDMGGQATKAVAAAEAVLQEATTAVAKQLQRAIPEAQNLFSGEDAGPAEAPADGELSQSEGSAQPSDSEDSDAEVC